MGMRTNYSRSHRPARNPGMLGFSMIEMMIVIALVLIISGIAFMSAQGALKDSRVNGAYDNAFMQLRLARQRAIEERKRYIVTFGTPAPALASTPLGAPNAKSIQVYRWDSGNPSPAPIQVSTVDIPSDVGFQTISGLPTSSASVPDGFGNGTVPVDFNQGFAPAGNLVMFMPDGSAHDLLGRSNNGILYIARNGDLSSSRAVTVFGTSGRVRGWRLTLPGGVATWSQQ
jgi:prepilin-type N-terminal cleavage/methylation domain-containing protein